MREEEGKEEPEFMAESGFDMPSGFDTVVTSLITSMGLCDWL